MTIGVTDHAVQRYLQREGYFEAGVVWERARFGVFEIGMNHAGEIEPLSRLVQPHAAVITNVGPVHTENFEERELERG